MLRVAFVAGTLVVLGVAGCFHSDSQPSSRGQAATSPTSATESPTTAGRTDDSSSPETFRLSARQAQEVRVVLQFIDAFNARSLHPALTLFSSQPVVSDCDYRRIEAVEFTGRREITRWLKQRFADRDRLEFSRIVNENPDQPVGVVAVEYARRASDTLSALGFRSGIKPQLATKVVFTTRGPVRIRAFANGPVGGSPESCRPA